MKHIIQYDNRYHHHHHCPCRTALSSWFSSPCWQCPPPLNRKCHDRQFFGQSVGSRHLFLWIFMSLIWRKYGICFGQHPWDFLSISRGEMGSASLPALTQAIFKAAKGPKPRCVAFLWCWVNMKNSHHRLQNGHRCRGWSTLGDARKETLRCEPCGRGHQFFEVRQYRGACGHRPIKKKGIHPSQWFAMFFIDLLKEDDMKTSKMERIHRHVWLPGIFPAISTHALRYLA